ncbi:MAG: class I SAM-dependent methyltransferase [Myxococcota bacterium]
MGRVHLFEIEDQPWCPETIREGCTAYITAVCEVGGLLAGIEPHLRRLAAARPDAPLVDLCSGAGGPARLMAGMLDRPVHCTDLYPHQGALARAASMSGGRLSWTPEPVDARAVPDGLQGPRTLVNAFHHFEPCDARRILEDAVAAREPIGVFELVGRQPHAVPGVLGLPLATMALLPLMRPFRWEWLALTYLVPLLPLTVMWDGLVSCLRVYSPAELAALVVGLDSYDWDIGSFPLPFPGAGTYLVGTPVTPP